MRYQASGVSFRRWFEAFLFLSNKVFGTNSIQRQKLKKHFKFLKKRWVKVEEELGQTRRRNKNSPSRIFISPSHILIPS